MSEVAERSVPLEKTVLRRDGNNAVTRDTVLYCEAIAAMAADVVARLPPVRRATYSDGNFLRVVRFNDARSTRHEDILAVGDGESGIFGGPRDGREDQGKGAAA